MLIEWQLCYDAVKHLPTRHLFLIHDDAVLVVRRLALRTIAPTTYGKLVMSKQLVELFILAAVDID